MDDPIKNTGSEVQKKQPERTYNPYRNRPRFKNPLLPKTIERTVDIRRVTKVVKGGKNLRFSATVVVGDGAGNAAIALGSSPNTADAVQKAMGKAKKNFTHIIRRGTTIPHKIEARFCGSKVVLIPAAKGTGIKGGGGVRAVMEACGITDIMTKRFGSNNKINVTKATLRALLKLHDPKTENARRLGKEVAPQTSSETENSQNKQKDENTSTEQVVNTD